MKKYFDNERRKAFVFLTALGTGGLIQYFLPESTSTMVLALAIGFTLWWAENHVPGE